MSRVRSAFSSPEISPPVSPNQKDSTDNSLVLQGLAASVKLLLKLIEDHNEACTKDYDGRKMQRVASMITIIDEVKSRIQKSQTLGNRREAALRRCNTELRAHQHHPHLPRDTRKLLLPHDPTIATTSTANINDEKEMLRMELSASLAARKSLEKMFSSLGKEKEIMASELARKVHELNGIEEHLNDLKAQNKLLLAKVQTCAAEHKCMNQSDDLDFGDTNITQENNVALEKHNRALSAHLLKSLGGYKLLKRRLKEAQEEKEGIYAKMVEMDEQAKIGLNRIADLRKCIAANEEQQTLAFDLKEELSALEDIFRGFEKSFDSPNHEIIH